MIEFLLHKLKFREQPPHFVDANPDTAVTTQVHEGIIECTNVEKVSSTLIIFDIRIYFYTTSFSSIPAEPWYL